MLPRPQTTGARRRAPGSRQLPRSASPPARPSLKPLNLTPTRKLSSPTSVVSAWGSPAKAEAPQLSPRSLSRCAIVSWPEPSAGDTKLLQMLAESSTARTTPLQGSGELIAELEFDQGLAELRGFTAAPGDDAMRAVHQQPSRLEQALHAHDFSGALARVGSAHEFFESACETLKAAPDTPSAARRV